MVENVTLIKSWIMISVSVSVKIQKNIVSAKKVIFGILQHVTVKIIGDSVVICNEIRDATKSTSKKKKTVLAKTILT